MEYLEESFDLQEMIDKQVEQVSKSNEPSKKFETLFPEEEVCRIMHMIMAGLH
eukprot:CAMPEP_0185588688 /NCGR_PEP_ID=MMETSP0434-20130131/54085_1 /TAXON_ID=626734 ORGANISM="Favella taraikaensis, Strain Fe Narragansett Bay" /NCGR_SAMPLE_ID=MMETSP0434 /ASSEMBLY_ACC=CAM_ASM_000379 /LENGTH=52 /DNA_ID=CAMNT_0028211539 /DNA_START=97 /DNA_END=252 /DNA_ORIENTATION=-